MKYFKILPTVQIDNDTFRNIFQKIFVESVNDDQLIKFRLADGIRMEMVAHEVYRDVDYWWVIAIINDIKDIIFDWPLDDEAIQAMAREKATINDVLNTTLFLQYYDELQLENDKKREIKIIKPSELGVIIKEVMRIMKS